METRAAIEAILDRAYAARRANDPDAALACFCDEGRFMPVGAPAAAKGRTEQAPALKGMFEAFHVVEMREHCRVIDPPRAVVHWRGTFRVQNGKVGEADILDLIEVSDGRIASLTTFFDTAYATALAAPP